MKIITYFIMISQLKILFRARPEQFNPMFRFSSHGDPNEAFSGIGDKGYPRARSKKSFNKFRMSAKNMKERDQSIEMRYNRSGYIMIFTLLVIGACMMMVTYIGHRGSYYLPFAHMMINREKAKALALSGVEIAIAQLAQVPKKSDLDKAANKETDKAQKASQATEGNEKDLLVRILPTLNRWQQFDLKEEIDGVDGTIKICLMCEEGKINLNSIIDFKKGAFKGDEKSGWKAIMQEICKTIERTSKSSELFGAFEKIIKDQKVPFNDATELVTKKEFNFFKDSLFYQPPTTKKQDTIYLTDIFTVFSSSDKLEPWLFSDSINGLFGLPRVEVDDIKKRKEQIENWAKNFKTRSDWNKDWQTILMPVYGKELRTLPKNIDSKLSTTFDPHFFSVLVHAKVGDVVQIVYAMLERNSSTQGDAIEYDVIIKKIYWL